MMPPIKPAPRAASELSGRLDATQRSVLEHELRTAQSRGRPFSLLLLRGALGEVPADATHLDLGSELHLVALPGLRIDAACALAERMVRKDSASLQVGVAESQPRCPGIDQILARAQQALRSAGSGAVGPVASMDWADVSRDIEINWPL